MAASIHIFGHSFLKCLKCFLRDKVQLRFYLNLSSFPLVQYSGYSGAVVGTLRSNLTDIVDFLHDIVVLVIGTNDLFSPEITTVYLTSLIFDLVDSLIFICCVKKIAVCQILHRQPTSTGRWIVNTEWFNNRVDETNNLLSSRIQMLPPDHVIFCAAVVHTLNQWLLPYHYPPCTDSIKPQFLCSIVVINASEGSLCFQILFSIRVKMCTFICFMFLTVRCFTMNFQMENYTAF
jgi:hypothetical protein